MKVTDQKELRLYLTPNPDIVAQEKLHRLIDLIAELGVFHVSEIAEMLERMGG